MLHCLFPAWVCRGLWTWRVDLNINYFEIFLVVQFIQSRWPTRHQLISPMCCNIASHNSVLIIWYTFKKKRLLTWWYHAITLANVNWWQHAITGTSVHWWYHAFTCSNVDLSSVRIYCISMRKISCKMLDGNHKTVLTYCQFDPLVTFITSLLSAKDAPEAGNNLEHFQAAAVNPLNPGSIFTFPGSVL